ncbi:hypothetical protein ACHAXT_007614 [Thalassiosira profunda]
MVEEGEPTGFIDIVQSTLCFSGLDYHAISSAYRTAKSPESYLTRRRSQLRSSFVSSAAAEYNSTPLKFSPAGGRILPVSPADASRRRFYNVSVPARVALGRDVASASFDRDSFVMSTDFGDNPCDMESTQRHPGTSLDSDCDDDEDMNTKYPEFQSTEDVAPITTVAAEQLACVAFVGAKGQVQAELHAAYPLQLSIRIDESRRCLALDCFEYKPSECVDVDCDDLGPFLPTERGWLRWQNGYHSSQIDKEDDDWDDSIVDDDWGMDERMEMKDDDGTSSKNGDSHRLLIYCGIAGHFAYSRCLRFRFPFENIVGIRLQVDDAANKIPDSVGGDATAVLILEVDRPPPSDAFAVRKVSSRWMKENHLELRDDWTPDNAASNASRIYLYGGLAELRHTAALMAKKCPRLSKMLETTSSETNSLRDGASIDYASAPEFAEAGKAVQYGGTVKRTRSFSDLDEDQQDELRGNIKMALCRYCGAVYYQGYSGLDCIDCGSGRWTIDTHKDPINAQMFDGLIGNALSVFEAKCERLDQEKRGTDLKRKVLG